MESKSFISNVINDPLEFDILVRLRSYRRESIFAEDKGVRNSCAS